MSEEVEIITVQEVNARLTAVGEQRNAALNREVVLHGMLAIARARIAQLEAEVGELKKQLLPPQVPVAP